MPHVCLNEFFLGWIKKYYKPSNLNYALVIVLHQHDINLMQFIFFDFFVEFYKRHFNAHLILTNVG
jgi:hypothetical protein